MANHGYKFIDPDLHVFEPRDLWTRYVAPEFRDQAPIGAPHSSTAARQSSTLSRMSRIFLGNWILPQPAQARLQRNSGSSISTSG